MPERHQAPMIMKVMCYNILIDGSDDGAPGIYRAGNRRDLIAATIRRQAPDILCMQEGGDHDYWREFAGANGYETFVNLAGVYRPALMAKMPCRTTVCIDAFSPGAVYGQFQLVGRRLGVYSIHLPPSVDADRARVAALMTLKEHAEAANDDYVCIAGDCNSRRDGAKRGRYGILLVTTVRTPTPSITINGWPPPDGCWVGDTPTAIDS